MFHNTAPPRAEVLERQSSVYPKEQNVMLRKGACVPFISAAINKNIGNFQLSLLGKQIKKKNLLAYHKKNFTVSKTVRWRREFMMEENVRRNAISLAFRWNMIFLWVAVC